MTEELRTIRRLVSEGLCPLQKCVVVGFLRFHQLVKLKIRFFQRFRQPLVTHDVLYNW